MKRPRKSLPAVQKNGNANKTPSSLPSGPRAHDIWQSKTSEELAAEQGVKPVSDPNKLLGDFWPEDESIDDFLIWLRKLRREGQREE